MQPPKNDLAQRVWQRVREATPSLQERQTLQNLIGQLEADAAFLHKRTSAIGRSLAEQLGSQAAVLRGVRALSTGNPARGQPRREMPRNWKQCYQNALDRLTEYLLRSADPQFAPVFTRLAEQTREHCRMIAQAAGEGEGKDMRYKI